VEVVPVAAPPPVQRSRKHWVVFGAIALVGVVVCGVYLYANRLAKIKVDEAIARLDGKVGLVYGDVSANPFTRSVTIKDVKVTSIAGKPIDGVSMESLSLKGNPAADADPQELDARVSKLTLNLARMGPEWAQVMSMGYGTVVVDSRLDYRFSRKTGQLDLNQFEIAGQDLLTVGLSLHLGEVSADVESPEQALSRPTTTIRGGEVMIKDAVFVDRMISSLAEKEGLSSADYKKRLTRTAEALLGGGSGKLERDVSAAIVRLINEPRSTLRITIAPTEPVSLEALNRASDPGTQLALLNLQVSN